MPSLWRLAYRWQRLPDGHYGGAAKRGQRRLREAGVLRWRVVSTMIHGGCAARAALLVGEAVAQFERLDDRRSIQRHQPDQSR